MKSWMFAFLIGLGSAFLSGAAAVAADAVLLDFSSAHCPPCRAMQPVLAQLERGGVPVRHVDVNVEQQLATRFGIRSTPTYVILVAGKEVTRLSGPQTLADLRAALAINPSGPLIQTGASWQPQRPDPKSLASVSAPQTRLAALQAAAGQPPGTGLAAQSMTPMASLGGAAQSTMSTSPAAALASPTTGTPLSEPMPSMAMADAVQRAKAATVRLRVYDGHGYGAGTGTIIDTHGAEALVLTCGHLFRETKGQGRIEVDLFIGGELKTVAGQVIDYDAEDRDIALVAIRPDVAVQPVQVVSSVDQIRTGITAFSFGCDRGDDPSRRDTRITGVNKYNQHLGASNLEIAGAPIDGRSGGGLFNEQGHLIGVCNAADFEGDVGIYAGPGAIQWQLDRVNLAHLYKSPAGAGPGPVPSQATGLAQGGAAAPPNRLASLPATPVNSAVPLTANQNATDNSMVPASAVNPGLLANVSGGTVGANGKEVIVIIRDRNNPGAQAQVTTIAQPSAEFINMIGQQSR